MCLQAFRKIHPALLDSGFSPGTAVRNCVVSPFPCMFYNKIFLHVSRVDERATAITLCQPCVIHPSSVGTLDSVDPAVELESILGALG